MSNQASESGERQAPAIEVIGVTGIKEVQAGDRLADIIAEATVRQGTPIQDEDIVVVTQKIVSKAEGRLVPLSTVEPSALALQTAAQSGQDPRLVELVLRESRAIVRMDPARGILITETRHGFICANAGVDMSNVPGDEVASLLPEDPDGSARALRRELLNATAVENLALIISDTFGRAWREGQVNFAIGVAGLEPIRDYRGTPDALGNELKVTSIAVADELAATAELVMHKAAGIPVAIVRGYEYRRARGGYGALVRDRSRDLFR